MHLENGPVMVMAPDGDPTAVAQVRVVTGELDSATEAIRRGFPELRLHAAGGRPDFRLDYRRSSDGRIAANRLRITGAVEVRGHATGAIAAGRRRSGRVALEYGRTRVDTAVPYLRPAGDSALALEDADVELIELDPIAFAQAASRLLEGTGRVLIQSSPLRAGPAAPSLVPAWHHLSDYVLSVASDPAAFASPLVRAGLFDLVVSGFLTTFPVTAERASAGGTELQPAAIRRALAYIDEHLADPIEVVEIAAAARVSVRALHAAFRRHLGVTPMEQVLNRRLSAVREELVRSDGADGVTVAEISRRWGFAHPSRFAARYRTAYGENPSDTLRR